MLPAVVASHTAMFISYLLRRIVPVEGAVVLAVWTAAHFLPRINIRKRARKGWADVPYRKPLTVFYIRKTHKPILLASHARST